VDAHVAGAVLDEQFYAGVVLLDRRLQRVHVGNPFHGRALRPHLLGDYMALRKSLTW
jgi:hypothetical protein